MFYNIDPWLKSGATLICQLNPPAFIEDVAERRQGRAPDQREQVLVKGVGLLRRHQHRRTAAGVGRLLPEQKLQLSDNFALKPL